MSGSDDGVMCRECCHGKGWYCPDTESMCGEAHSTLHSVTDGVVAFEDVDEVLTCRVLFCVSAL